MSGPALALQAEKLHTFYGKSHILHGVGLEVREGEIVTLLGRNGAGKSTTLRSLVGLTPPREGTVRSSAGTRRSGRLIGSPPRVSGMSPRDAASLPI